MRTTANIAQMCVRVIGVILLILGLLFWSGNALGLVNTHMALGLLFVIALWVLCGVGIKARISGGLITLGIVWGLIVIGLGMSQRTMMVGSSHWVIRVLHLLVGLAAIGIGESLAKRIRIASAAEPAE